MTHTLKAIALATISLASPVLADDIDTVRVLYTDILSNPAETTSERYYELFSPDVVSIPTPPGGEGAQGMLNTIAFLGQVVPDLRWEPEDIIATDDGRYVVRGTFTGTPVGPFLGIDPATGNGFEAMSIDIVTVDAGLISHVYHLEDWASVAAQLTAE